jgi:atypical dual specificity phosphatase
MEFPGSTDPIVSDLEMLKEKNIGAMVNLTIKKHDDSLLSEYGIDCMNIPVRDFTPPTVEQIKEFVDFADNYIAKGKAVVVHCAMGQGRTGTVLACYLVKEGFSPDKAIERIRALRPYSIETAEQEKLVYDFAQECTGK